MWTNLYISIDLSEMDKTRFIRIDDGVETVKEFDGVSKYDGITLGEVIEVVRENDNDNEVHDYYVSQINWDFTHFGNTLVITILPSKPKPKIEPVVDDAGETIGFIKT
jgi:hypothetical protein